MMLSKTLREKETSKELIMDTLRLCVHLSVCGMHLTAALTRYNGPKWPISTRITDITEEIISK